MGMIGTVAGTLTIIIIGSSIIGSSDINIDADMLKNIGYKLLDTFKVWST